MRTSFTEGWSAGDVSMTSGGGGMENEIRQLKALLGQLARDYNVQVC